MKRFNVVDCGRRFGKTKMALIRCARPALEGKPVGYFTPKYKYMTEFWREIVERLAPVIVRSNASDHRIQLVTGGSIEFWTMVDPGAGRSREYAHVAIDEACLCPHLKEAWTKSIRPTLSDYRGSADVFSTPKGHDYFWELYTKGQDPHSEEWASFQAPTASNPFIHPDEIEAARHDLPERVFQQEYLATFLEDAGGVFRGVSAAVDRGRDLNRLVMEPGLHYSMGVDLARVEDFTVITIVDSSGRQIYFDRFNQISWERQIAAIIRAQETLKATVFVDSTGIGDPLVERLRLAGLPIYPYPMTLGSKTQMIDNLAMQFEKSWIRLMDVPEQEAELIAFTYEMTPSRNVRMSAPEGMHDDCVISLALAVWGASNAGCRIDTIGAF